jgi:hypothetical protein
MGGQEILLVVLILAYFIPALVASRRHHHNAGAIFVLNLFLGWSVVGWVAALVWACTAVRDARGHRHRATCPHCREDMDALAAVCPHCRRDIHPDVVRARRASALALLLPLLVLADAPAHAMDTKDAGRCVALGALSADHAAKAEAVLTTARATGRSALVEQRVREEFAYLKRINNDSRLKEAWVFEAVRACRSF